MGVDGVYTHLASWVSHICYLLPMVDLASIQSYLLLLWIYDETVGIDGLATLNSEDGAAASRRILVLIHSHRRHWLMSGWFEACSRRQQGGKLSGFDLSKPEREREVTGK